MVPQMQRLETEVQAAMAAVRATKADPEHRPTAERALTGLHQYASAEEYPSKEKILSAVEQAREMFEVEDYAGAVQQLSRALIAVTRI